MVILGRQPALGLAELESLYGAAAVKPVGQYAALLEHAPAAVGFARLGGSIKLASILEIVDSGDIATVLEHLSKGRHLFADIPDDGKIYLGLSAFGFNVRAERLLAAGLTLKKVVKAMGHPVRLVPLNEGLHLTSAQVIHNKLLDDHGRELLLVRDGSRTIIGRTIAEQDIESYSRRDRDRPKRDAKVGMLPPKLAQIILNLATADGPADRVVLDPFCGTGVVLQEAALSGYGLYGTDLEPRMVEYTRANLDWLRLAYPGHDTSATLETGDATDHAWSPVPDMVAAETYLGRPFSRQPDKDTLARTIADCNLIIKKFLANIQPQLPPGCRLCLAVPAWQMTAGHFRHLPLLDGLDSLGYNRVSFVHAGESDMIYVRDDQIVARQLLVITRK